MLSGKEFACNEEVLEMWVQSLDGEDPLKEVNSKPLQYSFLENSMDRGVWQAMVHRVAKNRIQPKRISTHVYN